MPAINGISHPKFLFIIFSPRITNSSLELCFLYGFRKCTHSLETCVILYGSRTHLSETVGVLFLETYAILYSSRTSNNKFFAALRTFALLLRLFTVFHGELGERSAVLSNTLHYLTFRTARRPFLINHSMKNKCSIFNFSDKLFLFTSFRKIHRNRTLIKRVLFFLFYYVSV